jgi:hypothetical protein
MPNPVLPALSGVDFASRLVSNIYGLHKQKQDEEKGAAEQSRQSMLKILESAANSGSVNPEDMPALYQEMFKLTGAKTKDVETVGEHVRGLFSHPSVARKGAGTFGPSSQQGGYEYQAPMAGGESVTATMPGYTVPGVPQENTNMGPAVRLMTSDEKAQTEARGGLIKAQTLYPQKKKELDDANDRRLDLQGAKLDAQDKAKLGQIVLKGGLDAQKKLNGLVAAYRNAGYDDEAARGLAGKQLIREEEAVIGVKETQSKVNQQRVLDMQGRLIDMQFRSQQLKKKTDAYVTRMAALNANPGATRGSVAKANVATFNAYTKELYPAYTALKRELIDLKTNPDVDREDPDVKANISYLEGQITEVETKLKNARDTWLPKQPLPEGMGVSTGPASDGKHHYTPAQIRSSLKNGWTYEMALKVLQARPDVVIDKQ